MDLTGSVGITESLGRAGMDVRTGASPQKAAQEFESFLILTILKEFEKTTQFTKKSSAEQTQMSLFYEKVADFLSKKGIGIKQVLEEYMDHGAKVFKKNGEKM